jgi:hypothetical protein
VRGLRWACAKPGECFRGSFVMFGLRSDSVGDLKTQNDELSEVGMEIGG